MYWLSAERIICASHVLPGSSEDGHSLHGHNWRVTAHVCAERLDDVGRVLPVGLLEERLWAVLDPLDHRHLNDLDTFSENGASVPPTAAGLARFVAEQLAEQLDDDRIRVRRVEVAPRAGVVASWEQR